MMFRLTQKFLFLFVLLGVLIFAVPAFAGCAPGLPCVPGNATPNDPADDADGPNASGAPHIINNTPPTTGDDVNMACDSDLLNTMYSRAWLEAHRERIKAEILIRKPDSILEYTCFDQLASIAGTRGGPIFSQTTRWQNATVAINGEIGGESNLWSIPTVDINTFMEPDRLNNHIENMVRDSLEGYIEDSFDHSWLGGSASGDYSASGLVSDYNCDNMNTVYMLAKCVDMLTDTSFWTFEELIDPDPRLLLEQCAGTQITQAHIDLSNNVNKDHALMDDVTETYLELILAEGTGNPATSCAAPIPTGLMVVRQERNVDNIGNVTVTSVTDNEDAVCPNPNCRYTGSRCEP